jgi:acetyl esterase/lipase
MNLSGCGFYPRWLPVVLILLIGPVLAFSQARCDTVRLWSGPAPGAKADTPEDIPTLAVCLAPAEKATGCAIVVCPGGGYGHLAMDHEGKQVAAWLNANGIAAFILKYRIAPLYHHPVPLLDASRALRVVASRAAEWNVDPDRIGIMGFSAGGHLASSAGVHFANGIVDAADPIDRESCRPAFMVLAYPVITMKIPTTHLGSRRNLLGDQPDSSLVTLMSSEEQVSSQTPPAFLFHTTNDPVVAVENSLLFYRAMVQAGVGVEMHIFKQGPHGVGLAYQHPLLQDWPRLCLAWLRGLGMLK